MSKLLRLPGIVFCGLITCCLASTNSATAITVVQSNLIDGLVLPKGAVILRGTEQPVCQAIAKGQSMRVFLWPQPNTIDSYTDRFQEPITPFMVVHGGGVASVSLARFIYRYDTAPGGNYSAPGMPRWRNTPEQRAQDWKWFLAGTFRTRFPLLALGSGDYLVAAIDIDNDGKPEPIYVHPKGIYEPLDMSSGALVNTALYVPVILNSTLTEADTVRTRRLLRPGIEPELFRSQAIVVSGSKRSDVRKRVSIVLGSIDFRIFTFDGLTYLLHDLTKLNWGLAGPPKPPWKEIGTSRVWLTKNGTTNEICAFE